MRFTITPNQTLLNFALETLKPKPYRIAMQAAISRTLTTGTAQLSRIVGKSLNMKIGDIKKTLTTKRPNFDRLEGSITADRQPVNLAYFDPKQQKAGVRVKPWKDRPAQLMKSTFKMTQGRSPVYERQLSAGPGSKRAGRFPLQMRYGPNVITAIAGNKRHEGDMEEIEVDLSETLNKNMESQFVRVLENPKSLAKFD